LADRALYTNEASRAGALDLQTALAASKIRLFDGTLIPTSTTVKADLVAAETDLVGYPPGGYAVTAFNDPIMGEAGGDILISPLIMVVWASGAAVTIGGYWVEDAGGAVRQVYIYSPQKQLAALGDGFAIVTQFGYGGPNQI
jgi:hypothetical protein